MLYNVLLEDIHYLVWGCIVDKSRNDLQCSQDNNLFLFCYFHLTDITSQDKLNEFVFLKKYF